MKKTVHKSSSRGYSNYDWLKTNYSFSFANYYNPERIHFGNLRVLNDDTIAPAAGFGKHPHDNMEIITIPLSGSLMHEDSMGHKQTIGANEVQVMSAGAGIFHSEYNASNSEPVTLLQIWILADKKNIKPVYNQKLFDAADSINKWQVLVDNRFGPLKINQNVTISRINLMMNNEISYQPREQFSKNFIFIIDGEVQIGNKKLETRDAMEIEETTSFNIKALKNSYLINIEV